MKPKIQQLTGMDGVIRWMCSSQHQTGCFSFRTALGIGGSPEEAYESWEQDLKNIQPPIWRR